MCAKILYQVELNRGGLDIMWGFSVEAELVENSEVKQDELQCYVSRVEDRSVAINNGETLLQFWATGEGLLIRASTCFGPFTFGLFWAKRLSPDVAAELKYLRL